MNEKTVVRVLLKASEMLKADSDYVYDPEHKNRPHGGGTWYKTEKGWSTNREDSSKEKSRTLSDWMESTKNLNSTGKERVYDFVTRSQNIVDRVGSSKDNKAIYDMIQTSPRIRRNIIDQLTKEPREVDETFGEGRSQVTIEGFKNMKALNLGCMLADYYRGKELDLDFPYNEYDWSRKELSSEEMASLDKEDSEIYNRLSNIMYDMNRKNDRRTFPIKKWREMTGHY